MSLRRVQVIYSVECFANLLLEGGQIHVCVSRVFIVLQLSEFENQAHYPSWRIYPVEAKVPRPHPTSSTFHRYHPEEIKWCLHPEVKYFDCDKLLMKLTLKFITCFKQKFGSSLENIANNLIFICYKVSYPWRPYFKKQELRIQVIRLLAQQPQ